MPSNRESAIETSVCDYAKTLGVKVVKLSGPNNRGIPDRMFLFDGRVLFIEFKAKGEEPTKLQYKNLKDLTELGFIAIWTDNRYDGKQAIYEFTRTRDQPQ